MAQDVQILPFETADAPNTWTIPDALKIIMKAVTAEFDGTSAASAFLPTLEIYSDSGELVARIPTSDSVPAGGFAEVTWAPFLRNASTGAATGNGVVVASMWFDVGVFGDPFVSIPSGAPTDVSFANVYTPDAAIISFSSVANPNDTLLLESTEHVYTIESSSQWQLGGFVQQVLLQSGSPTVVGGQLFGLIALNKTHPADYFNIIQPFAGQTQGQIDRQVALVQTAPLSVTLSAYQQTGVAKNLQSGFLAIVAHPLA